MTTKGQNIENVKVINRASTLRLLLANGPMSRSDIAAELSITPATVTLICNEFFEKNLLIQQEECESPGKVGRKKFPVDINYGYRHVLAININPVETAITLCDLAGSVRDSLAMPTENSAPADAFLAKVAERCTRMVWDNRLGIDDILGAGVTVLGPVDHAAGISLNNFMVWDGPVAVQRILGDELHIPVCVESNVCALCTAAILYGETDDANLLALQWGPGVGSASVIGGTVFKGRNFQSAEVGHNFVDGMGEKCRCGKVGCLETQLSITAIAGHIKKFAAIPGANPLRDLVKKIGKPSCENLDPFLELPFPPLRDYLDDITHRLAVVVNNALQILAPDRLVLFGEMFASDVMLDRFKRGIVSINDTVTDDMFLRSSLQPRRNHIGAVASVVKRLLVDTGGV